VRVTLTVDGTRHELDVEPSRTLRDVLAVDCRAACPDGTCGACAVVLDGAEIRSCLLLAVQANGALLSTVDGRQVPPG
jgi:aerobic-type carbon monoxide dehydrogenase small subunit (CoxS/CutS family)